MALAKLYLDTNMWNRLQAQGVDAERLHLGLKQRNANLAVSGQTLCELARTFEKNPQSRRALSYVRCAQDVYLRREQVSSPRYSRVPRHLTPIFRDVPKRALLTLGWDRSQPSGKVAIRNEMLPLVLCAALMVKLKDSPLQERAAGKLARV